MQVPYSQRIDGWARQICYDYCPRLQDPSYQTPISSSSENKVEFGKWQTLPMEIWTCFIAPHLLLFDLSNLLTSAKFFSFAREVIVIVCPNPHIPKYIIKIKSMSVTITIPVKKRNVKWSNFDVQLIAKIAKLLRIG